VKGKVLVLGLLAYVLTAQAQQPSQFSAALKASNEVPPNSDPTAATGTFTLSGGMLYFQVDVPIISFIADKAYIQGPALPGTNAPVIFDLGGPGFIGESDFGGLPAYYAFASPFDGLLGAGPFSLTDSQINDLESGLWYVNVTSEEQPGVGILRGQILPLPTQAPKQFSATLSGSSEVPPNNDPSIATATFSLAGNSLSFSVNVPADTFNSVNGYIQGPALPGTNAPVIFDLGSPATFGLGLPQFYIFSSPAFGLAGTDPFTLTDAQVSQLVSGLWYVNITSDTLAAGQLRGQILPVVPPVLFRAGFSGRSEVPPNRSPFHGTGLFSLVGNTLDYRIDLDEMLHPLSAGIFGPARHHFGSQHLVSSLDLSSGVIIGHPPGSPGQRQYSGVVTLSDRQVRLLMEGHLYADFATDKYPNGEIRGQVLPQQAQ
jgi:hypothetical protein